MEFDGVKRGLKGFCPDSLYPPVVTAYTAVHPARDRSSVREVDGFCKATNLKTGTTMWYPTIKHGTRVASVVDIKRQRYSYPGFVAPEEGDVIVDVGAFVGEFTLTAAEIGSRVVAVEPDPRNVECLQRNVQRFENVAIVEAAVSDTSGTETFQLGTDPTENSLLSPDDERSSRATSVSVRSLEDICSEQGIETVDFLKVDAEGAEPEVVDGLGSLRVRKIAIDSGPEREGATTTAAVEERLRDRGFETRENESVVFGKRDQPDAA